MNTFVRWMLVTCCALAATSCHGDSDPPADKPGFPAPPKVAPVGVEQISPPLALSTPPDDAVKTEAGSRYKMLIGNPAGALPKPGDTVSLRYTGWIQRTGRTFFTTRGDGPPTTVALSHAVPGLADMLPRLHKGETAMLWLPASQGTPEPVVYEVELVDIIAPPAAPKQVRTAATP